MSTDAQKIKAMASRVAALERQVRVLLISLAGDDDDEPPAKPVKKAAKK